MKTKNTMTARFQYRYNELDALADYLEKQAAEGWELTSKTGIMLGFRRCEPKKVKISVELVYPDSNDWQNKRYIEYCKAAGWKHIFEDGKIQIFENEDLDAVPINTDEELKLKTIHRKSFKTTVIAFLPMLILGLKFFRAFYEPFSYHSYLSNYSIFVLVEMPILFLLIFIDMAEYLHWYVKARKTVALGGRPAYKRRFMSTIGDKIMMFFILWGMIAAQSMDAYYSGGGDLVYWCVMMVILVAMTVGYPFYMAKFNQSRQGGLAMYFVISIGLIVMVSLIGFAVSNMGNDDYIQTEDGWEQVSCDKIALDFHDLGVKTTNKDNRHLYQRGSLLLQYEEGNDLTENESKRDLRYVIYKTKIQHIYDMVLQENYAEDIGTRFQEVDEPIFNAEKVYHSHQHEWLILKKDKMIYLDTNFELTDAQKQIVVDKLAPKQ